MTNGEVLEQLEKTIDRALQQKRLSSGTRAILETQQLLVAFLKSDHETVKTDHERLNVVYSGYRVMVWVFGVLGVSGIGLLWMFITGQAEIVIK